MKLYASKPENADCNHDLTCISMGICQSANVALFVINFELVNATNNSVATPIAHVLRIDLIDLKK